MNNTKIIDIGDVIKHSGLPASTLRYYEEKGLIQSIGRNGLRRLYDSDILVRLDLIALGQRAKFSLDEISEMFTPNGPKIDRQKLLAKAEEIDHKIRQLIAMHEGLLHAAHCPAPNHFECKTFQGLLRDARKNQLRKTQFRKSKKTQKTLS